MSKIPLILIPGLASDYGLWEAQLSDLSDIADMQVGDTLQDDSLHGMAKRILDAAPPQIALAGLSMGGYVALEIMRQAPARISRLALLDTSAREDSEEQIANRHKAIDAVGRLHYLTLSSASVDSLVADEASEPVRKAVVDMAMRVGPDIYVRQQKAIMRRCDSRADLVDYDTPTMVIVGQKDQLTPPDIAREMANLIPGAVLREVPGAGHLPPMEKPQAINALLREWLA